MNQQCKVCGEPAAGFHFGAFTCEGCKVRLHYRQDRGLTGGYACGVRLRSGAPSGFVTRSGKEGEKSKLKMCLLLSLYNALMLNDYLRTTSFNTREIHILFAQIIYVFLYGSQKKNSHYFCTQNK